MAKKTKQMSLGHLRLYGGTEPRLAITESVVATLLSHPAIRRAVMAHRDHVLAQWRSLDLAVSKALGETRGNRSDDQNRSTQRSQSKQEEAHGQKDQTDLT